MSVRSSLWRDLVQQGKLCEAMGFSSETESLQFLILSDQIHCLPEKKTHAWSRHDAAMKLWEFERFQAEQKITRLQHQFQSLPFLIRVYYAILKNVNWCPLLPNAHRKQCAATERELNRLANIVEGDQCDAEQRVNALWQSTFLPDETLWHYPTIPLEHPIYTLEGKHVIKEQTVIVKEDHIQGWHITRPLFDDAVDINVCLISKKGLLIHYDPTTPEGFITAAGEPVFTSKSALIAYVKAQLSAISFTEPKSYNIQAPE